MDQFRTRLVVGATLMGVGFLAEVVMLSGLVLPERPPEWFWGLILCIGLGGAIVWSAFAAAAKDRRRRTQEALDPRGDRGAKA